MGYNGQPNTQKFGSGNISSKSGKTEMHKIDAGNRIYTTPQFNMRTSATRAPSSRYGGSAGKKTGT